MSAIHSQITAFTCLQFKLVRLVTLVFLVLPTAAFALVSGDFKYKVTSAGTEVIIQGYTGFSDVVEIPGTLAGLPVTRLGASVFPNYLHLTSVTIPASVKSIDADAFEQVYYLNDIKVDALNLAYSSLEGVLFDKSQTTLIDCPRGKAGNYAIPDGVIRIGDGAFDYCFMGLSVTIPGSVTSIGAGAFDGSSLTAISVDVLNPVYSSLDGVLFNKKQTTLIEYPKGRVGSYTIPFGVTKFGYAFFACYSLEGITIPGSVDQIDGFAFSQCDSLTSVSIPKSVTTIGEEAFWGCNSLMTVKIPDGVTRVGREAFAFCYHLKSVTIGNHVMLIGNTAFAGCEALTSIKLPDSLLMIGSGAFNGCNLKSITIPPNVTHIGSCAFYGYVDRKDRPAGVLTKAIFLGNAPESVGPNAFDNAAPGFRVYYYDGSKGFTSPEWKGYPTTPVGAEISVQQPAGSDLADGAAKKSFGTVKLKDTSASKNFTIKNTGTKTLTGLALTKSGMDEKDFILTNPAATSLAPGESTNFKVHFHPKDEGIRNAGVHVKSSDPNKRSFDIKLTGLGVK